MSEEPAGAVQAPPPPAPPAPPATGVAAPQPPGPGDRRGRGGGAAWFGVVLLVIGIGIIMGRVMPGMSFWGFWPASLAGILVIVFSIRGMFWSYPADDSRFNKVVEGFTGVTVGVILIANSVGAMSWSVWWSVLSLWPVLLVSAGLDLIGKGLRSSWIRVLSSLVVLVSLWYGAFVLPATSTSWSWWRTGSIETQPFEYAEPSDPDVRTGEAVITGPVGRLNVTDGTGLVAASGTSTLGEPAFDVSVTGSRAKVRITNAEQGPRFFGLGDPRLDVELDKDVIWDLTLDSGVSELDADLTGLALSELRVKTGVSNSTIELGDSPDGDVPVTFDAGISQLVLRIPRGTDVRVERDAGLSNTDIDSDLLDVDGGWETEGYDGASDRYTVLLKSGISDFRIELY